MITPELAQEHKEVAEKLKDCKSSVETLAVIWELDQVNMRINKLYCIEEEYPQRED